jgi:hypothetical protein
LEGGARSMQQRRAWLGAELLLVISQRGAFSALKGGPQTITSVVLGSLSYVNLTQPTNTEGPVSIQVPVGFRRLRASKAVPWLQFKFYFPGRQDRRMVGNRWGSQLCTSSYVAPSRAGAESRGPEYPTPRPQFPLSSGGRARAPDQKRNTAGFSPF